MADGDDPATADAGPAADGPAAADEPSDSDGTGPAPDRKGTATSAPLLFLLGGLAFLGGAGAFLVDLAAGNDVGRSLVVNAAGALVLVGWAAIDTLADPESAVDSRSGAAGTALLLYGLYLFGVALVVGVTSVRHGRPGLALPCGGGAVVAAVVGLVVFPTGVVVDGRDGDAGADDAAAGDSASDDWA
jgi:hypothetical protein